MTDDDTTADEAVSVDHVLRALYRASTAATFERAYYGCHERVERGGHNRPEARTRLRLLDEEVSRG